MRRPQKQKKADDVVLAKAKLFKVGADDKKTPAVGAEQSQSAKTSPIGEPAETLPAALKTDSAALVLVEKAEQQPAQPPPTAGQQATSATASSTEEATEVGSVAPKTISAALMPLASNERREVPGMSEREVETFLARGDGLLMAGDLASARLFYEYAAASGNGVAALRLGGTFDTAFLLRVKVHYASGDRDKALYWYRQARDLGNRDAEILLESMETNRK